MKKTLIALFALASVAVATDEAVVWTFATNGTYNGTEGASYAGFNFTLSDEMSSRVNATVTPLGESITSRIALDNVTLTTRGGKDVSGTYSLYVVDSTGKLMAVSGNSVTLDTNEKATEMSYDFTTNSSYGMNKELTLDSKYYAFLIETEYMTSNWTTKVIGSEIAGTDVNSIQLACYNYGNNTNQAEWGCAGSDRGVLFENYGPIASVTVHTVPEPTTATLSLLALAGLAARRRRK